MIGKEVDETAVRALANAANACDGAPSRDMFTLDERLEAHRLLVTQHRRNRALRDGPDAPSLPADGGAL